MKDVPEVPLAGNNPQSLEAVMGTYSFSLPKGKDLEKMDKLRGHVLVIELVCTQYVGSGTTINGPVVWNCARVRKR